MKQTKQSFVKICNIRNMLPPPHPCRVLPKRNGTSTGLFLYFANCHFVLGNITCGHMTFVCKYCDYWLTLTSLYILTLSVYTNTFIEMTDQASKFKPNDCVCYIHTFHTHHAGILLSHPGWDISILHPLLRLRQCYPTLPNYLFMTTTTTTTEVQLNKLLQLPLYLGQ